MDIRVAPRSFPFISISDAPRAEAMAVTGAGLILLAQATLPGTLPLWLSLTLLGGAVLVAILSVITAGVAGWKIWRQR